MIKSVSIFKNVDNVELFEQFYKKVIFPRLHKMPGVLYSDVTRIVTLSDDKVAEGLKGVEFILETYFESYQVLESIFTTPEGLELMQIIEDHSPGELSVFVGNKQRFLADWYKNSANKEMDPDQKYLDYRKN